jgi:magnesium-transporting ATPase (P-type)
VVEASGETVRKNWADLRIGNIIHVQKEELFPADMILLCTS